MVQIIDRRSKALGGQNNTRSKSAIKEIAWHYTATTNSSIDNHERFWRNSRGWRRGGYHFYIDRDGNIFQNYNLETVSNGVAGHNSRIVNVCCEASRADNYTQAQIKARHELTLWLMDELNIKATNVKQHGEFSGASTSCAGYTKAQMNEFRAQLSGGKVSTQTTTQKPAQPKKQASTGGSIVDYLNQNKINSSFANRKKLAREYLGISNYSGTAKQNTDLLNAMRSGVKQKIQPKASKSIAQMAEEVIANKHGNGHANRRKSLGISASEYAKVRAEVNRRAGVSGRSQKTIEQMAREILDGKHGNGHANRQRSLGVDNATYQKVRARVNQIM